MWKTNKNGRSACKCAPDDPLDEGQAPCMNGDFPASLPNRPLVERVPTKRSVRFAVPTRWLNLAWRAYFERGGCVRACALSSGDTAPSLGLAPTFRRRRRQRGFRTSNASRERGNVVVSAQGDVTYRSERVDHESSIMGAATGALRAQGQRGTSERWSHGYPEGRRNREMCRADQQAASYCRTATTCKEKSLHAGAYC